jgi:hypothetical protein
MQNALIVGTSYSLIINEWCYVRAAFEILNCIINQNLITSIKIYYSTIKRLDRFIK